VQGNVLLRHQPRADALVKVLVEEGGNVLGFGVPPAFEESARERGDGVGVSFYDAYEALGEFYLLGWGGEVYMREG